MGNAINDVIVSFDRLSEKLMTEAEYHTVVLLGVRGRREVTHCGTGTLIRSGDRYFILTAAHCVNKIVKFEELGLVLKNEEHRFTVSIMQPIYIGNRISDEWGPDLAFLPLQPNDAGKISAYSNKIFYNLDRFEAEMVGEDPAYKNGYWVLTGAPDVYSTFEEPSRLGYKAMAYHVNVAEPIIKNDFDYLHIPVALDRKNVPANFEGVSGGGLWWMETSKADDESVVLAKSPRLEGCAFFETPPQGEQVFIRCHGWRSIYVKGLAELRLR